MDRHLISIKFGCVAVKLHRCGDGWLPVLVGQHSVPYVPRIDGCMAGSEADALTLMADAIGRLEAY